MMAGAKRWLAYMERAKAEAKEKGLSLDEYTREFLQKVKEKEEKKAAKRSRPEFYKETK
jgi:hypothetical protein